MRNILVKKLIESARENPNLYLLTADLGYRSFEPFREEFPDRFINVGVAEANMIGLATGLALMGKKVCAYSIVPFVTYRCLEQIRNDVCCHNLDIKLFGGGGGFSYGNQGVSHNTTEDLAIMRSLPNMSVFCPADRMEADLVINSVLQSFGPAYLRLGRAGNREIYQVPPDFKIGQGITVRDGQDLTIIFTGNIIEVILETADLLAASGLSVRIISMPCIKPLDSSLVERAAQETGAVFTVEEHSIIGGLGSAVADVIMESGYSDVIFKKIGVPDVFPDKIGSQQFLRDYYGLASTRIANLILNLLK